MSFREMQHKPTIIWSYAGNYSTRSHYLATKLSPELRFSVCGRIIPNTGDDMSCPQNEPCECKACNKLIEREYWRYAK